MPRSARRLICPQAVQGDENEQPSASGTKKESPKVRASPAAPVQPTLSSDDPVALLAQLREAEQKARERVAAILASDGQIELAKATRELRAVKDDIAALLKANPQLA
ncbi:MAG TPA: hypothetical protein VKQ72_07470 [Aggregatilineales bacterium]|nr:hypothetical protein [Aggregatilineales bacterium]